MAEKVQLIHQIPKLTTRLQRIFAAIEPFACPDSFRRWKTDSLEELEAADATAWFYEVVWPQRAMVLRTAIIQTGNNVAEAEELTQATRLKAFRGAATFSKKDGSIKAWLMT